MASLASASMNEPEPRESEFVFIDPDIRKARTLPARMYSDPILFRAQCERVFARTWQYAAHDDVVKVAGQVYPFTLLPGALDEPLLLTRDAQDTVHALSNVCTHRGSLVVDGAGHDRFPTVASGIIAAPLQPPLEVLSQEDVQALLDEAYAIARRTRGQIRRPLGSTAEVTITVVDTGGHVLGLVRTPDAPIFGIDVAVQKARTAMFFSSGAAAGLAPFASGSAFLPGRFDGSIAWTARAIGNLHRPTFPDGIEGTPNGPFSTPMSSWSPFNVGLQEDLILVQLVNALGADVSKGCVGRAPASPPVRRSTSKARHLPRLTQVSSR